MACIQTVTVEMMINRMIWDISKLAGLKDGLAMEYEGWRDFQDGIPGFRSEELGE